MPQPKSPVVEGLEDREIIIAKDQPEYTPLPALVGGAPMLQVVLTRWTFTPEERVAIQIGEDLFLTTLTFGHPLQPIKLTVGEPDPEIQYDNRKDVFDQACGDVVRAWKDAMLSVSAFDVEAETKLATMTKHLLGALHSLIGTTVEEPTSRLIS